MPTVPQIIDQQTTTANTFIAQASGFINQVAKLADVEFSISLPTQLGFGATDIVNEAFDRIENRAPVRPSLTAISGTLPSAPVLSFQDIDETLIDALQAKLITDLEEGGYGIEPDDEAALWQRERDREAAQATAQDDEIVRSYAEGGFAIPPGAMFAARARAQEAAQAKISSVNRDIALRRSDLYVQNRQFTIQQAGSVQGLIINLNNVLIARVQALTAVFQSQIAGYRADIDGQTETLRANLGIYAADVQAFATVTSALGEAYRLKLTEVQFNNNWNVEVVRSRLEEARVRLLGQHSSAGLRLDASRFGANYYLGVITAALGSIATLAAQTEST